MKAKTGWRVRAAIFQRRHGGAVFFPSGHDAGSRKRGFPTSPPPNYRPPEERIFEAATLKLARQKADELRLEHGADKVAIHIEPIEKTPAAPRPKQTSLANLGDWPRGWPSRGRWTS